MGNRLIASEKLIKVYLLWPLQGSVRGYIREISVAMFLQIQTDIHLVRKKWKLSASETQPLNHATFTWNV